jgi:hypothetical protein
MKRRNRCCAALWWPLCQWGLLCLGALQVHAQIDVRLLCGDGTEVGASVQVTIAASVPQATPLGAFDAVLSWDPDQLSFLSIADGDYGALNANTGAIDAGRVNFNAFDAGGRAGEFSLAQLTFQRTEGAGERQVNLSFAEISAARTFADLLSEVEVAPCLVGGSTPDAGSADEAITMRFEGPAQVEAGAAVEWTLIAAIPTGAGVGAFDAGLRWDAESLRFLSIADGDYGGLSANTSRADAGQVNFNSFDSAGREGVISLAIF